VKRLTSISIILVIHLAIYGQVDTSRLSIVFAGDIMGHDEQITGARVDSIDGYNYEPTFRYVRSFIEQADIAIGNLEVTLAGKPYKGYPQFSSPMPLPLQPVMLDSMFLSRPIIMPSTVARQVSGEHC